MGLGPPSSTPMVQDPLPLHNPINLGLPLPSLFVHSPPVPCRAPPVPVTPYPVPFWGATLGTPEKVPTWRGGGGGDALRAALAKKSPKMKKKGLGIEGGQQGGHIPSLLLAGDACGSHGAANCTFGVKNAPLRFSFSCACGFCFFWYFRGLCCLGLPQPGFGLCFSMTVGWRGASPDPKNTLGNSGGALRGPSGCGGGPTCGEQSAWLVVLCCFFLLLLLSIFSPPLPPAPVAGG